MNRNSYERARQMAAANRGYLLTLCLVITVMEITSQTLLSLGLIGMILAFFLLTVKQGYVTGGMFLLTGNYGTGIPVLDGFSGVRQIKKYWPFYLLMNVIQGVITVVFNFLAGLLLSMVLGTDTLSELQNQLLSGQQYSSILAANRVMSGVVLIVLVCGYLVNIVMETMFLPAPYLLLDDNEKGVFKLVRRALAFAKGKHMSYLNFALHYTWPLVLMDGIDILVSYYISSPFLSALVSMIVTVAGIYVYRMEKVCAAASLVNEDRL